MLHIFILFVNIFIQFKKLMLHIFILQINKYDILEIIEIIEI